uniref:hypothetical protein n=1 Tax=Candidatus Electronema sp. TaxID=2698783 RepID=UPI00405693CD
MKSNRSTAEDKQNIYSILCSFFKLNPALGRHWAAFPRLTPSSPAALVQADRRDIWPLFNSSAFPILFFKKMKEKSTIHMLFMFRSPRVHLPPSNMKV